MAKKDASPISITCPNINEAQGKLKSAANDIEYISKQIMDSDNVRVCDGIVQELDDISNSLEGLREENAALREWGNEQYQLVQSLEKDLEYSEKEVQGLKEEIQQLQNEIRQYEAQETN